MVSTSILTIAMKFYSTDVPLLRESTLNDRNLEDADGGEIEA